MAEDYTYSTIAMGENYTYPTICHLSKPGEVLLPSSIVTPEIKILHRLFSL
jgi:hypothetical protein